MRSKRLGLLLLLLLLTGCSSTTFFYNRLGFLIPWYAGKYVDLDRAQKALLKAELAPFLTWHRSEELPRYRALLDELAAMLDAPVDAGQLAAMAADMERAWERLELRSLDWLTALGARLSEAQVTEFIANLWEKQREYEEEYLERSDREYRKDAYENLLDASQDYLGRLDQAQRQRLRQATEEMQRSDSLWLSERARWLQRLEQVLQREPGWQQTLRDDIARREQTISVEYRGAFEHNSGAIYRALADVLNSRSPGQDRRLRRELEALGADIDELVRQGQG